MIKPRDNNPFVVIYADDLPDHLSTRQIIEGTAKKLAYDAGAGRAACDRICLAAVAQMTEVGFLPSDGYGLPLIAPELSRTQERITRRVIKHIYEVQDARLNNRPE